VNPPPDEYCPRETPKNYQTKGPRWRNLRGVPQRVKKRYPKPKGAPRVGVGGPQKKKWGFQSHWE